MNPNCGDCHHTTQAPRMREEIISLKEQKALWAPLEKNLRQEIAHLREREKALDGVIANWVEKYSAAEGAICSLRADLESAKRLHHVMCDVRDNGIDERDSLRAELCRCRQEGHETDRA